MEEYTFVDTLKEFVEEECVEGTDLRIFINSEGHQCIEIQDPKDESPWFTLEGTEAPQEGQEDNFEGVAEMVLEFLLDIMEQEIARQVDEKAILN